MVQFSPFAAWRYDLSQVGDLSDVIAPATLPIPAGLVDELYQRHPCNAIRVVQNREEPGDESDRDRCIRAADFLRIWKHEGILFHEHEATFYVCQQLFQSGAESVTIMSVIGRLRIVPADDPAILLAYSPQLSRVNESRELLMSTGAQFFPLQALVIDDPLSSDSQSVFNELLVAVQGLTPLQVSGTDGVTCRIWPLTSLSGINQLQVRLADSRVIISSGVESYVAARELSEASQPDLQTVMVCLSSAVDPGIRSLPPAELQTGSTFSSADEVQAALQTHFVVEFVGAEVTAADDARQLAALNERQPAVALGTGDGRWFVVSDRDDTTGPSDTVQLLAARDRLAAAIRAVLAPAPIENVTLLLPAVSVDDVVSTAVANQTLPDASFQLFPTPPAGLVYDSLWSN